MTEVKKILFECQNLTLRWGTGIATYARNLAIQANNIGYQASALYGVKAQMGAKEAALDEIAIFDAKPPARTLSTHVADAIQWLHSDALGVWPRSLPNIGIVVAAGLQKSAGGFAETHIVPNLSDRARQHFIRYGQLMKVRNLQGYSALHTTQALPIKASGCPTICTIHDIIPLRLPSTTLDNKKLFHQMIKKLTRDVDHIVTVSEQSKKDIIQFFDLDERRITNTYQSVDIDQEVASLTVDQLSEDLEMMFNLSYRDYYLFVGAIEPKKNISRLIEAYSVSGLKRPLILAGNLGWQYDDDVERINDERFVSYNLNGKILTKRRSVQHLSYIPRSQLMRLMRGARALVFPSLYEGFGLPVLEAMALGTPVITSNTSSLPEVVGDAAVLVDPYDANSISQAFKKLDRDDDLHAELSRRGLAQAQKFSSKAYQQRLSALYQSIM